VTSARATLPELPAIVHIGVGRASVAELTAEITRCEREIDFEVYQLFGLTPAEIALIATRSERDSTD